MGKMIRNYHSHTFRCGHASGSDEQYVQLALENGFVEMGFTDHVILPDLTQTWMRGDPGMKEGYLRSVASLKEKYKGKIKIYTGFECEWFGERYEGYYRDLLTSGECDYLILGQHCYLAGDSFIWYYDDGVAKGSIDHYCDDLIAGMRSGLFSYVCHPDMFLGWYRKWDEKAIAWSKRIIEAALEVGIPLEVNMGPASHHKDEPVDVYGRFRYPVPEFWDLVGEMHCPVIIGLDCHWPALYRDGRFQEFLDFCDKHHLNRLEKLEFRDVEALKNKAK